MKNNNDNIAINNIKMLGIDAINAANSGHPGIVLGIAPIVYQIFKEHLNYNISDTKWLGRDKFVLSAGHGSALLYSTMFYFGYESIKLKHLKRFRQMCSKTPGHPERWCFEGVEATTGPLGQGIGQAVGMALAQKWCKQNLTVKPEIPVIDSWVYVLCGDGDLEEGVSYESMSFAGHNNLNNLIIIYDSNKIQLDGKVSDSFSENIKMRVESQNFNYYYLESSHDINGFSKIIDIIKKETNNRPSFIEVNSIIGEGTLLENSNKVHGAPLNSDNLKQLRKTLKWDHPEFFIDEKVRINIQNYVNKRVFPIYKQSINIMNKYKKEDTETYYELNFGNLQKISYKKLLDNIPLNKISPVRTMSSLVLNNLFSQKKLLLGGSADLSCSTKIGGKNGLYSLKNPKGQEIAFGVREFSMGLIATGINCTGLLQSYCSTFFSFSDYLKGSIRLTAISNIPTVYIFSHDSFFVGEDGPTHEPIEQLGMVRAIPNVVVWRPYNVYEVATAFKIAFESKTKPTIIVTSRQDVDNRCLISDYNLISKGGYIISPENSKMRIKLILLASGSEVDLALKIQNKLRVDKKISARVVSIPSFYEVIKDKEYLELLLNYYKTPICVIEASNDTSWLKILKGKNDHLLNITEYGYSGKGDEVAKKLGFTVNLLMNKLKIYYNF